LHISYSLYILHNLVSTSDDELEAPGTELLSAATKAAGTTKGVGATEGAGATGGAVAMMATAPAWQQVVL